jgi:serine/threonine protein kinase
MTSYSGLILKSRYTVEREIGRGGIAIVCLARDMQLASRPVVIKILLDESSREEWLKRKFRQEIEALARIDHPGVVGALDAGEMPDGRPFIVMQYVEGSTLRQLMKEGSIGLARAGRILRQIGQALTAAHEKGIFHRDLKPENVMIQTVSPDEEYVKLIDFGIASITDPKLGLNSIATTVAGTVYYMAPEQLQGRASAASDVFAMGVIAYELTSGRRPYEPRSPFQLLDLQRTGVRVTPSRLNPSVSEAVDASILRALSFEPKQRHPRARDFGDEIAKLLAACREEAKGRFDTTPLVDGRTVVVDSVGTRRDTSVALPTPPTEEAALAPHPGRPVAQAAVEPAAPGAQTPPAPIESKKTAIALVLTALGLMVAAFAAISLWRVYLSPQPIVRPEPPPLVVTPTIPDRVLSYSITVQKYRDGKPYEAPFDLAQEINFERDYRVRLNVSSPQAGYLYVINEGPPGPDGTSIYGVLFPRPRTNAGSPLLSANAPLQIPEQWFQFDAMEGTEKLWFVWAEEAIPELEDLAAFVNPTDKGAITNPSRLGAVRELLSRHMADVVAVNRDETAKRTTVSGAGPLLVYLLKLSHH